MKITIIVEKTGTGFSARAEHYSAYTTGGSLEELRTNMVESLNLFFEGTGINIIESDLTLVEE